MLSLYSLLALAVMIAAIVLAALRRFPAAGTLLLANVAVFIIGMIAPSVPICPGNVVCEPGQASPFSPLRSVVNHELGLHPELLAVGAPIAFLQLLTHMFVHANFLHLLGNLIVLLAFALPFEERVGHRPFLAMYLGAGFVAAFAQLLAMWGQPTLMVGASGAVFGIIGAFAASYPRLVIPLPLPLLFIMIFVRMRVMVAAAVFALQQIVFQYLSQYNPGDNVAYFAHLGGLAAGVLLGLTYVRVRRAQADKRGQVRVDVAKLEPFATDAGTQRAYERLHSSMDEPEVFQAWLERFFVSARCPVCDAGVAPLRAEVVCTHGHRFPIAK